MKIFAVFIALLLACLATPLYAACDCGSPGCNCNGGATYGYAPAPVTYTTLPMYYVRAPAVTYVQSPAVTYVRSSPVVTHVQQRTRTVVRRSRPVRSSGGFGIGFSLNIGRTAPAPVTYAPPAYNMQYAAPVYATPYGAPVYAAPPTYAKPPAPAAPATTPVPRDQPPTAVVPPAT